MIVEEMVASSAVVEAGQQKILVQAVSMSLY